MPLQITSSSMKWNTELENVMRTIIYWVPVLSPIIAGFAPSSKAHGNGRGVLTCLGAGSREVCLPIPASVIFEPYIITLHNPHPYLPSFLEDFILGSLTVMLSKIIRGFSYHTEDFLIFWTLGFLLYLAVILPYTLHQPPSRSY